MRSARTTKRSQFDKETALLEAAANALEKTLDRADQLQERLTRSEREIRELKYQVLLLQKLTKWNVIAKDGYPDVDTTVLMGLPGSDSDPVWPGWWDGEEWHLVSGETVDGVTCWMDFPELPNSEKRRDEGPRRQHIA